MKFTPKRNSLKFPLPIKKVYKFSTNLSQICPNLKSDQIWIWDIKASYDRPFSVFFGRNPDLKSNLNSNLNSNLQIWLETLGIKGFEDKFQIIVMTLYIKYMYWRCTKAYAKHNTNGYFCAGCFLSGTFPMDCGGRV